MIMNEAATSEIDHFDLTSRVALDQNVLRLQVAVDQSQTVNKLEGTEDLLGDSLKAAHSEIGLFFHLPIVLAILVEVISQ